MNEYLIKQEVLGASFGFCNIDLSSDISHTAQCLMQEWVSKQNGPICQSSFDVGTGFTKTKSF